MQLYLCEKPAQAKDIAKVLGVKQRGQGFLFGSGITVTWAIGHLLEVAAPEHYGEQFGPPWRMEVMPVLPVQWQWSVKKETAGQFAVVQQLLKQADEVIIATDADREGEVIARELLEYCHFTGPVRRLWLSALDETHKATTYPRTDCGYLPMSMQADIPVVLTALVRTDPAMTAVISQLDRQLVSRVWNDTKITAHHAIIPTRHAFDISRLTTDELKVYQLIRQHYLAQFLPTQETDVTEVTLDIGGPLFRVKGRVNVMTGWKALFTDEAGEHGKEEGKEADLPLPALNQGDRCQVIEAKIQASHTKPPAPFTEGTLIAAMKNAAGLVSDPQLKQILRESAGLGTEATRAGILDTLFKRRLIERKKKAIHATPLAQELIAGLPTVLTDPGMTALWEQSLEDIAQGKASLAVFMQKQAQWLLHLVGRGKTQPLHLTLPKTPACPNCGGRMRQRQGKTSPFWGCVNYPACKGMLNDKAVTQSRKARRANQKV
ncbi:MULTISPECIES: DNA topoisomerase [Xenorhabdus]|uniref:DNA topoisomerase n=1 Tax=Xenorhabdus TaxID=626 RepID=UPI000649536A|nr:MULTISPECIES: DNA topoisomerase [Xenorhabdus]KLU16107.1 DNA topoisomerase III [Xenorhabdus griffiniae]KOP35123.1 DNA topoisomerase III [Xenorhabdus sp. GDc328]